MGTMMTFFSGAITGIALTLTFLATALLIDWRKK